MDIDIIPNCKTCICLAICKSIIESNNDGLYFNIHGLILNRCIYFQQYTTTIIPYDQVAYTIHYEKLKDAVEYIREL